MALLVTFAAYFHGRAQSHHAATGQLWAPRSGCFSEDPWTLSWLSCCCGDLGQREATVVRGSVTAH